MVSVRALDKIGDEAKTEEFVGIGHRIVHGGHG